MGKAFRPGEMERVEGFAMAALQGLLAAGNNPGDMQGMRQLARQAWRIGAMMERERTQLRKRVWPEGTQDEDELGDD